MINLIVRVGKEDSLVCFFNHSNITCTCDMYTSQMYVILIRLIVNCNLNILNNKSPNPTTSIFKNMMQLH